MIDVTNVEYEGPSVRLEEMEIGVLYKSATSSAYGTVYMKSMQGQLIWFENTNRIGTITGTTRFVKAPKGTKVVIENKA